MNTGSAPVQEEATLLDNLEKLLDEQDAILDTIETRINNVVGDQPEERTEKEAHISGILPNIIDRMRREKDRLHLIHNNIRML